jgi:hypothetical protein
MALSLEQLHTLTTLIKEEVEKKGASFYHWINAPEVLDDGRINHTEGRGSTSLTLEVGVKRAMEIYKGKLDGVYGERLVLSICTAVAAAKNGKNVALLQIQEETNAQFDPEGWLVLAIEGHPLFHIAPNDLPVEKVNLAGLITFVEKGSPEAAEFAHKGTNKAQELTMLMELMF